VWGPRSQVCDEKLRIRVHPSLKRPSVIYIKCGSGGFDIPARAASRKWTCEVVRMRKDVKCTVSVAFYAGVMGVMNG
jgi:hypothetical protein